MKKLLAITLTLCMVFSLVVMPVSAGTMIEKQLTPTAAGITSNDIAANSANVGSNVADGDADTMAIVDGYGRGVYVDLGAEYDLTSLEVVLPSADEIISFVAENGIGLAESVSAVNTGAQIRVGGNSYGSYVTANSTLDGGAVSTRLNTASQNIGQGKTITYTNLSAVRYIVVTPTAGSTPIAVTDIKARAMVEVGATQIVEKQITPVSAGYYNNNLENTTTNKADNAIDGSESTFTLVDGNSGSYLYIDLGGEYDLTQVEVVFPDDTSITNFIAANSFSTDAASAFNSACTIWSSTAPGDKTARINADGQGMANYTSKTWTGSSSAYAGLYGETKYRYITFYSGAASSPFAISEVKVYGMVEEEITFDVDINAAKVQYGYESDGNLALDAVITAEYKNGGSNYATYDHSYLIDNDPSTVALIGGRAQFSTGNCTSAIIILDLGEPRYLTNVKLDPIAESEESDFVAGLNVTNISNAGNVNDGVHVYVSNTLPTYDEPGEQISTSQIATAESSDYTLDGTTAYRYVAIKNLAGSYPAAFSGITIKDNTVQKEKLRFIFEADFTMDYVDSFGAYIIPFDLFNDDLESNVDVQNVENSITAGFESGSLYAVDVTDIPDEAKAVKILAIPYVSYDSEYYFGTSVAKTVNEVLAEQAQ